MFLSWIGMALHHVGIRWENAIAAIEEQIGSEEAVVFHEIENFGKSTPFALLSVCGERIVKY